MTRNNNGVKKRSKRISKLEKQGLVKKIAQRLYASNMDEG